MKRIYRALCAYSLILLAGCAGGMDSQRYIITTSSTYTCCKMINYQVETFSPLGSSTLKGDGVVVRLLPDSVVAHCNTDAEVPLIIANNGPRDIYVPISRELEGGRIKLYPWRLLYENKSPVRLARQIQYGDLLERTDGRLAFYRVPSGREVRLMGVIPGNWVCVPPTDIPQGYLQRELDPTYYADYSRALRDASARDGRWISPVGLRYDIAYTTLDFWNDLPESAARSNSGGDTTWIDINVKETPASFLNASQQIAESNIITLHLVK